MKKKLMMVALLLGTLSLGACVDDNETASVSAVREATAKQLKSVAAMNRAEAEATRTLAAAEVALMQAKAAAEKANAAYSQALTEQKQKQIELVELQKAGQSIEIERQKAYLEEQLVQLEVAKQEAQKELAAIAAQMEKAEMEAKAAILNAQRELKIAQQELLNYEEQLAQAKSDAERAEILAKREALKELADAYADAVTDLNDAKTDLYIYKSYLVAFENNLISDKEAKEKAIAEKQNQIAQKQLEIESYKKYANYTENIDALKAQKAELQAKQDLLYDDYRAAQRVFMETNSDNSESEQLTDSLYNKDKFATFATKAMIYENSGWWSLGYYYDKEMIWVDYTIGNIVYNSGNPLVASFSTSPTKYIYKSPRGITNRYSLGDTLKITFPEMPDFRGDVEWQIEAREAELKSYVESTDEALAMVQRKYNGTPTKGDFGVLGDDGQPSTEPCKNLVDSTAVLKAQYEAETDDAEKAILRDKYQQALNDENNAKNEIDWRTSDLEYYTKILAQFQDQWDMLKNYATYQQKLQAAIDTRNIMVEKENAEEVATWYNYKEKFEAYKAVEHEIKAIDLILNGTNDTVNDIYIEGAEDLATYIKTLEDEIAELQAEIEDYSAIQTKEEVIVMLKDMVAAQEAYVKTLEIIVAQTKADLDAAVAENEGTKE